MKQFWQQLRHINSKHCAYRMNILYIYMYITKNSTFVMADRNRRLLKTNSKTKIKMSFQDHFNQGLHSFIVLRIYIQLVIGVIKQPKRIAKSHTHTLVRGLIATDVGNVTTLKESYKHIIRLLILRNRNKISKQTCNTNKLVALLDRMKYVPLFTRIPRSHGGLY